MTHAFLASLSDKELIDMTFELNNAEYFAEDSICRKFAHSIYGKEQSVFYIMNTAPLIAEALAERLKYYTRNHLK